MTQFKPYYDALDLKSFNIGTLKVDSEALADNCLGDTSVKVNPVLIPRGEVPISGWPVVVVLSGFAGNGTKSFNDKGFELNYPEEIDQLASRGHAPLAIYVFVDAWTSWGGSQFVNSKAMGNYEDYVVNDLVHELEEHLEVSKDPEHWAILGGSSGGYGALHLGSKYPHIFGHVCAIAPDSLFEASLLPEIYSAVPIIGRMGGLQEVKAKLDSGKLLNSRSGFTVLNAVAMCRCYLPADNKEGFEFPIDLESGALIEERWKVVKSQDPVVFLHDRRESVEKLKSVYLDVGSYDEYHLQFGSRQIRSILRPLNIEFSYTEFEGTHRDLSSRRGPMFQWLNKAWDKLAG